MAHPAFVMHKQIYIQTAYTSSGAGFLSKKSIPLTENTKLVVAVYQEEQNRNPNADDSWDAPPPHSIAYSVHVWEALGDEYTKFQGWQHLEFNSFRTSFNRHLAAQLILRDNLKEPNPRYTHYEVRLEIVIFEPMAQIGVSTIESL